LVGWLGVPRAWAGRPAYGRGLRMISEDAAPTFQDATQAATLICATVAEMRPTLGALDDAERDLLGGILACGDDPVDRALTVSQEWETARRLLTKLHPAQLLTVRNTRGALEAVGYRFPKRELISPALDVPDDVRGFYVQVEDYLSEVYFNVERALFPERKFNVGFVKCGYQQRLASSLEACRLSMERRRDRVKAILADTSVTAELEQEAEELLESDVFDGGELWESVKQDSLIPLDEAQVRHTARIEIQWLDDLLSRVGRILASAPDPKIARAIELVRQHLDAGDSVLVFSRYTDTLSAVERAFRSQPGEDAVVPYGVYTGQTATLEMGVGTQRATRGEIRQALDTRAIKLVLCSDAASEGLNLQAARVLINVDVPWNPARLEQRIGRVARLGQRAASVDVYNLWYPDSIEARMYKRLMDRRDLYELAVGEFPEVVSSAIRDEVATRFGGPGSDANPLARLQQLRSDVQLTALHRLWVRDASGDTLARRFRDELAALAKSAAVDAGGSGRAENGVTTLAVASESAEFAVEPGRDDVISLRHPALRWLGRRPMKTTPEIRILALRGMPAFFATESDAQWAPVAPEAMVDLIGTIAGLSVGASTSVGSRVEVEGSSILEWMPRTDDLAVPATLECAVPTRPEFLIADMDLVCIGEWGEVPCK